MKVTLYGKPDCCLCDLVESRLVLLRKHREFDLVKVNILEDPQAEALYRNTIPAVTVDGKLISEGQFNENKVAAALGIGALRRLLKR